MSYSKLFYISIVNKKSKFKFFLNINNVNNVNKDIKILIDLIKPDINKSNCS